jgi:hypothetical protein
MPFPARYPQSGNSAFVGMISIPLLVTGRDIDLQSQKKVTDFRSDTLKVSEGSDF